MRKPDYCICEKKAKISCAVTAQRISAFVFATQIRIHLLIPLACFCDCTGRFESHLVGNPKDRFSRVAAHTIAQFLDNQRCGASAVKVYPGGHCGRGQQVLS